MSEGRAEVDYSFIMSIVSVIGGFFGTYLIAKLLDRYCSTEVNEDYIAMMLARFEEGDADEHNIKTIFKDMTVEERRSVLEKALVRKVSLVFVNHGCE